MLPAENRSYETVVLEGGLGAFRAQNQDVLVDCLQLNSDVRRQREGGIGRRWLLFRLYSLGGVRSRKQRSQTSKDGDVMIPNPEELIDPRPNDGHRLAYCLAVEQAELAQVG